MNDLADQDLRIVLSEARREASRLRFRLPRPDFDPDDIAHDLLLDFLRRFPRFDRSRGQLGAFSGMVMRNRGRRVAARCRAGQRHHRYHHVTLDFPGGRDRRPLAEILPERDGLWARSSDALEFARLALSIEQVLGRLAPDDLEFCVDLTTANVSDLVRTGRYSRSGLYRRLARLRCMFCAWGLDGRTW